jgi:hypothetical protein
MRKMFSVKQRRGLSQTLNTSRVLQVKVHSVPVRCTLGGVSSSLTKCS